MERVIIMKLLQQTLEKDGSADYAQFVLVPIGRERK